MYPTSAGYKSAIASYARETRITGKITLADSTILAIYPWLVQQGSLYLNEQCVSQDGFEIGNVYAGELGIGLISTIGEFLNRVDNGDFVNSTDWGAEHGSLSVANNTCQLTANGSDDHSAVIQNVGAATITNHYYVRARVRVTNSSCSAIKAKVGGSEVTLVSTPVINQWYDASAVMIAIDTNQYVSLSHHYASVAIASGKVMEIQYVSEVDLTTAFGSPNEPDAAEVDEYIDRLPNYHWNGVVGWTDLATVGYAKRDFAGCVLEPVFEIYTTAWESVPLGVFNEIDISGNDQYTSFQALDNMILLDEPRGATDVTSVTPEQLITGACATAGVTLATSSATFNTFPNYNLLLTLPDNSPVETCRDIVMWACQVNGTFARFNRAGKLEIVPLHSASARSITKTERFSPTKVSDRLIKITQIDEKVLETIYSVGAPGQILYLDGNPFLESLAGAAITTALTNLLADLTQAEYTPYEIQFIGDPSLQPGDYVTLEDTNVAVDPVGLVTHTSWRYRGNHTLRSAGNAALVATIPSQNGKALTAISADLAHIVDLIVTGTITVGSGTTFESGYDPITKRTVFTATPTTPYRVGDLWLTSLVNFTGDMKKCVTQRLTGAYVAADWVVALGPIETAKLGTTVIEGGYIKTGLVSASNINVGTLAAARIAASSITAEKLRLGNFDNLLENPGFELELAGWTGLTTELVLGTINPHTGNYYLVINADGTLKRAYTSQRIEVVGGDIYFISGWYRSASVNGTASLGLYFYDKDDSYTSSSAVTLSPSSSYALASKAIVIPSTTKYIRVIISVLATNTTGAWAFDDIYVHKKMDGDLIVDGTITASKINTTDLSAERLYYAADPSYYGIIGNFPGLGAGYALYNEAFSTTVPVFYISETTDYGFSLNDSNGEQRMIFSKDGSCWILDDTGAVRLALYADGSFYIKDESEENRMYSLSDGSLHVRNSGNTKSVLAITTTYAEINYPGATDHGIGVGSSGPFFKNTGVTHYIPAWIDENETASAGGNSTYWIRIARFTLTSQYVGLAVRISVLGNSSTGGLAYYADVYVNVLQQAAMGSAPVGRVYVHNGINLTTSEVTAIIVQNDAADTIIELFVKAVHTYKVVTTRVINYYGNGVLYMVPGSWVSAVPAGTALTTY